MGGRRYEEAYRQAGLERNGHRVRPVATVDAVLVELPGVQEFPIDAMPRPCRVLIREASASIGCPLDFVAVPMLTALGSAIGNSRLLKLKTGWEEGAAIYAAAVADPGEKKTPALNVATEPVKKLQAALREEHRRALNDYKRKKRKWEIDRKTNARSDLPAPPEPEEPRMERTLVEDTTVEALAAVLEGTVRGVLAVRDELSGWVRSMDQYKQGGRGADRQFYLSSWSNSYVGVDRKNLAEPLSIQRPFSGVFGAIQPAVLPELGEGRNDGLLDRFLFTYPEPVPSRWIEDEISDEARDGYARLYRNLREKPMPMNEYGDPDPVRIHFAPGAKAVLVDIINAHREAMEQPGFSSGLKGPWSKLEAYLAHLCLILAMARATDEDGAERVESRDALSAFPLLDYFRAMVRRVYIGLHDENPDDRLAEDLTRYLQGQGGYFRDEPSVLHENLRSDFKPERADELTKRLKAIAHRTRTIQLGSGNFKKDGQSRRFVELSLRNGVNGVNPEKNETVRGQGETLADGP